MPVPLYTVDAFTKLPFNGNPAAVCLLDEEPGAAWMQHLAGEMNLSETAFLWDHEEGSPHRNLRWFTPQREVDLCGHATLASAHVLYERGHEGASTQLTFHTNSGPLTCQKDKDGRIRMGSPSHPPYAYEGTTERINQALGTPPEWVGENGLDLFIVLETEEHVRTLDPDMNALAQLGGRGIIVTAKTPDGTDMDFVSRFFAPSLGVPEDPVTGSAHCALGPYWANRLDKDTVTGRQVSKRGGTLQTTITDSGVEIAGHAVTVLEGTLTQDAAPPQD